MKFAGFANATLLGLLLMPLAHAQLTLGLKSNIPFEFRIGDKTLAAGEYGLLRNTPGTNVLIMRNLDYKSGATMFVSNNVQAKPSGNSEQAKLVFHRYGKTYFLSQVWSGYGETGGLQLVQSKAERTIVHQMASVRKPDTIEIALVSFHPQDGAN